MADLAISDLNAITNLATGDLLAVSSDQGGGNYLSRKITAGNFDMVRGIRYYGSSATDPAAPAPQNGDQYYNTALSMWMFYDSGRTKWISIETMTIHFGRLGNTAAATYYKGIDSLSYSNTDGIYAPWNGTVVALGYTRTDNDNATFEVTANGAGIATLASAAVGGV